MESIERHTNRVCHPWKLTVDVFLFFTFYSLRGKYFNNLNTDKETIDTKGTLLWLADIDFKVIYKNETT